MKSIAVKNIQSLEDVVLELGRITVLVGDTDVGKSALVRAVEMAAFNEGSPEVLTIKNGKRAAEGSVRFVLENDDVVEWFRTAKTTRYRIVRGGVENEFKNLKKAVPDEVADVLNLREVQIDNADGPTSWARLQFRHQHDLPFLVVDRGGVAASRILGRLTGVHVFAEATRLARADGLALGEERDRLVAQAEDLAQKVAAYEGLDAQIAQVEAVERQVAEAAARQAHVERLSELRAQVAAARRRASLIADPMPMQIVTAQVAERLRGVWTTRGRLEKLSGLRERLAACAAARDRLAEVRSPSLPDLAPARAAAERIAQLRGLALRRGALVTGRLFKQQALEALRGEIALLDERRRTVPLCPFVDRFAEQTGAYQCEPLAQVIDLAARARGAR